LLADKTRLHILRLLAKGERNVMSLCKELSVLQPTVSHHLGVLREHGLVLNRRNGKEVLYSLQPRAAALPGAELIFSLKGHVVRVTMAENAPAKPDA
jgi:DNA-binding transcriptional ArsR family regulator